MPLPPAFLDEIRSRLTCSSVVGRRVRLVKKGREYSGLCPFHNEKSPSFFVNDDKGFFHCFGCGAHGDVIGFAMRIDNLTFPEAVERLAGEAGLEVPRPTPQAAREAERRKTLADVTEAASRWYADQLWSSAGRAGLDYLRGRGLADDTIRAFRLGFAPEGRDKLRQALTKHGLDEALLLEAGLIVKPEDGREPFDFFRGRVVFPIADRRGATIAFGGRILGDGQPKYLNSRDTPLFDKGRNLYALDKARLALREGGEAIVAEGYMDVIALHAAGFAGAVAPLGTALTEAQLELVWRLAPEPVVCLDGDAAGQRAALRAAERALPLLRPGRSLRFAVLPPGEDPDSVLRAGGRAALADTLAAARPLVDVLWDAALAGRALDTPERRAALEADLNRLAAQVADGTVQAQYRRELRDRLWRLFRPAPAAGTRAGWVPRAQFRRGGPPPTRHAPAPAGRLLAGLRETGRPALLLALAIDHPELLDHGAETIASIDFSGPAERVKRALLDLHARGERLDGADIKLHLKASGLEGIVARLLGSSVYKDLQLSAPDAAERARMVWAKTLLEIRKESAEQDLASVGDVMTEEWQLRIAELNREIARAHAEQIEDEPPFATPVAPRGTRGIG